MNKLIAAILKAGLLAGTLDILSAFVYVFIKTGQFVPSAILKFIASGLFGTAALTGGTAMIVAGLILHYLIAFAFTILFFRVYPKVKAFSKNKIVTATIYGIFTWLMMNLIVVPLSNVAARPFNITNAIINILILIACIGFPLSFMAAKFYKEKHAAEKAAL